MKLHEKIRAVRKAKNISQIVISNKLNITVQSYSMKETGKRPITTNELEIISNTLGVSPSYFFEKEFNIKLNKTTA
ncbi:helix-turn-helix domain-containing protein [Cytobacillus firmus]|uniref:Helix-turn-helix domain-containing protein n=1 Tax=Cytobacillus firmus TaxID=1399 RepID=A0AA46SFH9_CYTFI|nr:helix-turn-helix transcriptional regulator [Cytobacillus firmus]KML36370.1 Cro/Cl family transcriptional regulator [Cytobacillus firmus]UYG96668.1 helix-turn-helix domain-containing protein [Cytobacillus firmus]